MTSHAVMATGGNTSAEAHRVLSAAGIHKSPKWVQRTVRQYPGGAPFGVWLLIMAAANDAQIARVRERADLRYLLEYGDPTGETAVRNVMARS